MKVILLEDIRGLGKKNDIKDVSSGYARNFLLPKKIAEVATGAALKRATELKLKMEAEYGRLVATLKEEAEKIEGEKLVFKVKTGEKDEVFGSVTARDIEHELAERGIPGAKAELKKPLKELGEHLIDINFGENIKAKVKVLLEKIV